MTGDYSNQPWQLRKWQEDILRRIFGTLDRSGRRKIREVMLLLGRKNGKSQLAAGLAMFCLLNFLPDQHFVSMKMTMLGTMQRAARQDLEVNDEDQTEEVPEQASERAITPL